MYLIDRIVHGCGKRGQGPAAAVAEFLSLHVRLRRGCTYSVQR